ncbi:MAG: cytochrome c biogenesis heme-transporting ATPase CcmA [Hydrogenophaga sp.]|uniref:cytochrome c biogenesis heme-transporting ATPase CcmA n=1 Tax=Hydrogenophaga sp. TaxID=1904254 RepID=UPI003D9B68CE
MTSEPLLCQPLVQARGLSCRRGRDWLFRDLSFVVLPGQVVWLRGTNGSGKTTLLRTVCGLSQPDAGQLVWPTQESASVRPVYVGHLNALKDDLTASEALRFVARLQGVDVDANGVHLALRVLGMHHRRHAPVRTLSQGQRRRVALARLSLDTRPSLWVLDEPFEALDADGIATVQSLIRTHQACGGSVLLTSHLPLDAEQTPFSDLTLDGGGGRL